MDQSCLCVCMRVGKRDLPFCFQGQADSFPDSFLISRGRSGSALECLVTQQDRARMESMDKLPSMVIEQ
jgi:hypothetical protein